VEIKRTKALKWQD